MIENQNIRQILAIMVTDIVSYTETMNEDENKAWDYMNSPPSEPQLFSDGPGGRALYDNAGYQGESTIIPLVEISG